MALVDPDDEGLILQAFRVLSEALGVSLMGVRDRITGTITGSTYQTFSTLEQSFVAGKVATRIGVRRMQRMSEGELIRWLENNSTSLSAREIGVLDTLRDRAESLWASSLDTWQQRVRTRLGINNQAWRRGLETGQLTSPQARNIARAGALAELLADLRQDEGRFIRSIHDSTLQTQMVAFFQEGQVADLADEELVWKQPQRGACAVCLDAYTNPDGSARIFKLDELRGQSNIGLPKGLWGPSIGPTHPWCYCVLHRALDVSPPQQRVRVQKMRELEKLPVEAST